MKLQERTYAPLNAMKLWHAGLNPLIGRLMAAREISDKMDLYGGFDALLPPEDLKNACEAASYLASAIADQKRILIISDYDCDGATACAVGVRGLRALGADIDYLVPDRLIHGYGLTPEIVELAGELPRKPDLIITVDNGISSAKGVARANELGMPVLVTDHHLPPPDLPDAVHIVNPNQLTCGFPSKMLAGCGVMWYVIWALEKELARQGKMPSGFCAADLLPLVALGTVADVVPLDKNNRTLVKLGIDMIRRQKPTYPGIEALAEVGNVNPRLICTSDFAFGLGPRINAAGRLKSMREGIECLVTDDFDYALQKATELQLINDERKELEAGTVVTATAKATSQIDERAYTITVHDPDWHPGVIGIVAGRVREVAYRPTFVLASAPSGEVKGSGRSIPGFHLKHALDLVRLRDPELLVKYGGHAMAAGLSLPPGRVSDFRDLFEEVARELLKPADLLQVIETDGSLPDTDISMQTAMMLRDEVWGQGFPEPAFCDTFTVESAKLTKNDNGQVTLRLDLTRGGNKYVAVRFRHDGPKPEGQVKLVYKLAAQTDRRGKTALRLLIDHIV